jgi:hypothetical protein
LGLFLAVLNSHFFLYENNSIKQRNQQQTNTQTNPQRILHNDSVIERFLSSDSFAHQNEHLALINSFSSSVHSGGSGGGGGTGSNSDSSLSYAPFTPSPTQSVSRETILQDQFDNAITIKSKSSPLFDVNAIHCSLEHTEEFKGFYFYWAWIDLAMNVFIPFTGKLKEK